MERTEIGKRKVRLMGLSVSGFPGSKADSVIQLELPLEWQLNIALSPGDEISSD